MLKITLAKDTNVSKHQIILASHKSNITSALSSKADEAAVKTAQKDKAPQYQRTEADKSLTVLFVDDTKEAHVVAENVRQAASGLVKFLNSQKTKEAVVSSALADSAVLLAFAEGAAMSSYQFLKYKTLEKKPKPVYNTSYSEQKFDSH
jgi:hypothetical protein